jgi:hypothetical protein
MIVSDALLETILSPYKGDCRYLTRVSLEYPQSYGDYCVRASPYIQDTGHLNGADLLICFNQLAYVMLGAAGEQGLLPELGVVPLEQFRMRQLQNSFIVGMDNVRYRKPIAPGMFSGRISVLNTRRSGGLYVLKTAYDFENGSATGNVDLATVL